MFPIYPKKILPTPQELQKIKLDKKLEETIVRGLNRHNKQIKAFEYLREINRGHWEHLIDFRKKIITEFSKTNLNFDDLNFFIDEFLKSENNKHSIFVKEEREYQNSVRFIQKNFFLQTYKLRLDLTLRIYRTGEVYFILYRPCTYSFYFTSIEELKNGFSFIDLIKKREKNLFFTSKYEKMCDSIFSNNYLFPKKEYGTNTESYQKEYIKDCINIYLTRHLRTQNREPMLFDTTFFNFYSDNKPRKNDVYDLVKQYLENNNITINEIIEDFLSFRNNIFNEKLRTDSYKKLNKDYPNFYCMFTSLNDEKRKIENGFHDKYKFDIDCLFDKLPLNNQEFIEAKSIFC